MLTENDFVKGAYNVHDHNHVEQTLGQLDRRGKELSLAIRGNYLVGERKAQVQAELGLIAFALYERHREGQIEVAHIPTI